MLRHIDGYFPYSSYTRRDYTRECRFKASAMQSYDDYHRENTKQKWRQRQVRIKSYCTAKNFWQMHVDNMHISY